MHNRSKKRKETKGRNTKTVREDRRKRNRAKNKKQTKNSEEERKFKIPQNMTDNINE